MHVTILDTQRITQNPYHNAFTSICQWRDAWYLAYRQAPTHHIVPPGHIHVHKATKTGIAPQWDTATLMSTITHPNGDVRDPRFIPALEALYMLCGVYVPFYGHTLSLASTQNLLQTHITYTTDGDTWTPLQPILRPNVWGWSALAGPRSWVLAAYRCGSAQQESMSIEMYGGHSLLAPFPFGTIYDGIDIASLAIQPSEPILYEPAPDMLACSVRTETQMILGVTPWDHLQQWRWQPIQYDATGDLHPSAITPTPYGTLMVAREVSRTIMHNKQQRTKMRCGLYALHGQSVTLLEYLPSAGDCAYGAICPGASPGEYLVSYYSQHAHFLQGAYHSTLPGSDIYITTIRLTEHR